MQDWNSYNQTVESLDSETQAAAVDADMASATTAAGQGQGQDQKMRQVGGDSIDAASSGAGSAAPTPPSPAQAGIRDDPDWIMISTFSRLGLPGHNNMSFPDKVPGDWGSLPYGQLEEQLRSRGISLDDQNPALKGLSRDMVASILSSKDQSAVKQPNSHRQRLGNLAGFLVGENGTLITGEQVFETDFVRVLIFSMLNGFAGLSDIPMENILRFLGRLVIHSVFLRILEESPPHTSRTLSDNIFRAAIEAKDAKVAKMLLDRSLVRVNEIVCVSRGQKYTPVELAAELGALPLIKVLVAAGADVNKSYQPVDMSRSTVSHLITAANPRAWPPSSRSWAARTPTPDLFEAFEALIEAGANVTMRNVLDSAESFSTYDLACRLALAIDSSDHKEFFTGYAGNWESIAAVAHFTNEIDAIKLILVMIDKCTQDGCGECLAEGSHAINMAAVTAAQRGHVKLVQHLIDYVDLEEYLSQILTAAIISEKKELVDLVLARQPNLDPDAAPLNTLDGSRATTPFAEAMRVGNEDLIKKFEAAGALENLGEGERFEPLLLAAIETGNISYVRDLVARATTSRQAYRSRGAAFIKAIRLGYEDVAQSLLEAGFGVDGGDSENIGALGAALERRNRSLVYAVLNRSTQLGFSHETITAAIEWCDPEILFDIAIASGCRIHFFGHTLTALCKRCIETDNIPFFRRYVEYIPDTDRISLGNCLCYAIEAGHTDMIEQLLDLGADPLADGPIQAAIHHRPEMLQTLCANGREKRIPRKSVGASTLKFLMADVPGNAETLETLLDSGVVNLTAPRSLSQGHHWGPSHSSPRQVTPLGLAIIGVPKEPRENGFAGPREARGHCSTIPAQACGPNLQAIRRLLRAGSDPNGVAMTGTKGDSRTPLMLAIQLGRADIVDLLLSHGADVNQPPCFHTWRTPLQYAAEVGSLEMVRLLLQHGADVNAPPHVCAGGTALQFAAIVGSCPLAAELLRQGAYLSALPSMTEGRWPLEAAAEHGRLDMIRFLWDTNERALASGVHHEGFSERRCLRAMDFAQKNGHIGCQVLIEELSGVDVGRLATDDYGVPWLAY